MTKKENILFLANKILDRLERTNCCTLDINDLIQDVEESHCIDIQPGGRFEIGKHEKRMREIGICMDELELKGFYRYEFEYLSNSQDYPYINISFHLKYIIIQFCKNPTNLKSSSIKYSERQWRNKVLAKVDELLMESKDD